MQYLVIKNRGECPIEGFTILGVSTSRGLEGRIGQFGSGSKHGVLTCLRMGLNPLIWVGRERLEFHTQPALCGSTSYNKVFVKHGNKTPRELSMSLEFGALDWSGVEMALREFVSNALDAVDGDPSGVEFRIMERPRPEPGYTLVCVPLTPEVQSYYNRLSSYFLHFRQHNRQNLVNDTILEKTTEGPAAIYRKGVLVRNIGQTPSLFDYNFGDSLSIDECRNLSDYSAEGSLVKCIAKSDRLSEIMSGVHRNPECFEGRLSGWTFGYTAANNRESWHTAFRKAFGPNAVIGRKDGSFFNDGAIRKGYQVITLPDGWYEAALKAELPTSLSVCENIDDKGNELLDPSPEVLATLDRVWDWVTLVGLTNGKDKPKIRRFKTIMKAESELMGYYNSTDKTIYIGVDYTTNTKVMLEEVAHYITGATDNSRDFQDWSFNFACEIAQLSGG